MIEGRLCLWGSSLPNTHWRREQVPKESSKVTRITWDFEGRGNKCEVGETMMRTPLSRDYKRGRWTKNRGWKISREEDTEKETLESTGEERENLVRAVN